MATRSSIALDIHKGKDLFGGKQACETFTIQEQIK
jgi:hypothetical protein